MFMQAIKLFLLIIFSGFWLAHPAELQAKNVFTVDNIHIVKKAKNASAARTTATSNAEVEAFKQLIRSVTRPHDFNRLPVLSSDAISLMVSGYEVENEQIGPKSYEATFTITFDPVKVKAYLKAQNAEYVEKISPAIVVLPIFQSGEQIILWEGTNPWFEAWKEFMPESRIVPMVLPLGDLKDLNIVSVEDAFSGDFVALNKLADKYDASKILLAEAIYDEYPQDNSVSIELIMRTISGDSILSRSRDFVTASAANKRQAFREAVEKAAEKVQSEWWIIQNPRESKEDTPSGELTVIVPLEDIQDWIKIKRTLEGLKYIEGIKVVALSSNQSLIDIKYKGDFSTFSYFMRAQGLELTKSNNGNWVLTMREK
jgi:hypothetical protein